MFNHVGSRCAGVVLALCFLGFNGLQAQEASAPSQAEMDALVKQLGHDDFQQRQAAVAALSKIGMPARTALEAGAKSADLETRNASQRLLESLRWLNVKTDLDYLASGSAEALLTIKITDLKSALQLGRKTALVQLFEAGAFKPFYELFLSEVWQNLPEQERKDGLRWIDYFTGHAVGFVNKVNLNVETENDLVAVLQLVPETKDEAWKKFMQSSHLALNSKQATVKGLPVYLGPGEEGAFALLGNHFIIGTNAQAVIGTAERLITPPEKNFGNSPRYQVLASKLSTNAPLSAFCNLEQVVPFYAQMIAQAGMLGPNGETGMEHLKGLAWSMSPSGEHFEERLVMEITDDPQNPQRIALQASMKSDLPLEEMYKVVPAGSAVVFNGYSDGPATLEIIKHELKKLQANPQLQLGEMIKHLEAFQQASGIKLDSLVSELGGSSLFWVKLESGLMPPEIGMAFNFPEEAKAKAYAEKLLNLINSAYKIPELAQQVGLTAESKLLAAVERDGFTLMTEPSESPLMKFPQRQMVPYRLSLAAYGKRVIVSSSPKSLVERLTSLRDSKPSFDIQGLLTKTGRTSTANPIQIVSIDMPQLLQYGSTLAIPFVAPLTANNPPFQKALNGFMEASDPFKTLVPMTLLAYPLEGNTVSVHMHSSLPTVASIAALGGGIGFVQYQRMQMMMQGAPMGGAVVVPPAQGAGEEAIIEEEIIDE